MIILSNIQKDKIERLSKILLIQQLNEKPLVFFKFEEDMSQTYCLVLGKYLATKEAAVAYFFAHFFSIASSSRTSDRLYKDSKEICGQHLEGTIIESWWLNNEYFTDAWNSVTNMKSKYEPKEVLGWVLEKNIKVI